MPITIVNSLPEAEWRRFVEKHPHGNIFHTPEMFQAFARVPRHQPMLWAAVDQDDRLLALLLLVQITLMNGLLRRFTTRAISYGGVLCAPTPEGRDALAQLLCACARDAKGSVLFTELRNASDLSDIQPVLEQCGFVYEDHLNYLVDLNRSVEDIFNGIERWTRKRIRRGLRHQEVAIEEATDRCGIKACYDLIRKSYTLARVPVADLSLFEAAFDILHPRGMVKYWLARVGNAYVASSVELLYRDVVYGWYGGVDRAYAAFRPGELLTWHLLKWGAENGYKTYDFGGAGKPNEKYGVRDFKAKFGGSLVCYGRNVSVHRPQLLRLSRWAYQLYRRWL